MIKRTAYEQLISDACLAEELFGADECERYAKEQRNQSGPNRAATVAEPSTLCVISSNNANKKDDPTDPEPILAQCPMCDAENVPMGQLGKIIHYRCRQCNMVYNYGDCNV